MGIDVFGVFQRREKDRWFYVSRYYGGGRSALRAWLGAIVSHHFGDEEYGLNWLEHIPLIAPLRGLPTDLDLDEPIPGERRSTVRNILGEYCYSWLLADEILQALPVLAVRTFAVPLHVYHATKDITDDVERWKAMTGLSQEPDLESHWEKVDSGSYRSDWERLVGGHIHTFWERLVSVNYRSEKISHLSTEVPCECVCDFSDEDDVPEFINELRQIQDAHGEVRFVYGFA